MNFADAQKSEPNNSLVKIPPGKYLMAEKTEFIKFNEAQTGLLIKSVGEKYRVVLVDDTLVIL